MVFLIAGCGQKKESSQVVSQQASETVTLQQQPDLPQNSPEANSAATWTPDYSFHPIPDEQEPVSPEIAAKHRTPVGD